MEETSLRTNREEACTRWTEVEAAASARIWSPNDPP